MADLKQTPIFPAYEKESKLMDFGGWKLPVQFSGIKKEHEVTRNHAGLFDVSHMGEILVSGPKSRDFLQKILTNDVSKLEEGKAQYTFMCNETGGTVDDLILYMLAEERYLLVVNAANIEKDFEWLLQHKIDDVLILNESEKFAQLAIQGPKAEQILQRLTPVRLSDIKFFRFKQDVTFYEVKDKAIVSRTGYTGEDGFEVYIPAASGISLWEKIRSAGERDGLEPVGLGARDTLRFEACLPLYGQELNSDISPIEVGMGFAVKPDKEIDFIGKKVLLEQKVQGADTKLAGLEMIDKGIPRTGYKVFSGEEVIGTVTTGTQSPTLKKNIGLALLDRAYAEPGNDVMIEIRNDRRKAKVVEIPFYKRK